jgi:transcriptional regulator of acetoin/glycerol metabolism
MAKRSNRGQKQRGQTVLKLMAATLEYIADDLTRLPPTLERPDLYSLRRALLAATHIVPLLMQRAIVFPVGARLREVTDLAILQTLEALEGNKRLAARTLGISHSTLYKHLATLDRPTRRGARR